MSLTVARRRLLGGMLALFGVVVIGGGAYETLLHRNRRYPRTPYDDIFDKLSDRDSTRQLGAQALRQSPAFDVESAAEELRHTLKHKDLEEVLAREAKLDRLAEVRGWILPQTLVALAALTAKAG